MSRKRDATETEGERSNRKRKRSLTSVSGAGAAGGSSSSALTIVSNPPEASLKNNPYYEKFFYIQKAFWAEYEELFLHDMAVKTIQSISGFWQRTNMSFELCRETFSRM